MNNLTDKEKSALEIMKKENFRNISKENVMEFMSILDRVSPEVAKELIAQIPEAIRGMIDAEKLTTELLKKGVESTEYTTGSCFQTEDEIIKTLQQEIGKEDTSFEEKKFYFEKMEDAAKRKEVKDTEHRKTIHQFMEMGGKIIIGGMFLTACWFIGKGNVAIPGNITD